MKAGELIERIACVTGAEIDVVKRAARDIREDGLLTTGARGVNSPDMVPIDAARLLIALFADPVPGKAAAKLVRKYGAMANPYEDPCDPFPFSIQGILGRSPETFESGIAGLIEIYALHQDNPAFIEAGTMQYDPETKGYTKLSPPECLVELSIDPEATGLVTMGKRHESPWQYNFTGPLKTLAEGVAADPRLSPVMTRISKVHQGAIAYIAEGFR